MDDVFSTVIFRSHSSNINVGAQVVEIIPIPVPKGRSPSFQVDVQILDNLEGRFLIIRHLLVLILVQV